MIRYKIAAILFFSFLLRPIFASSDARDLSELITDLSLQTNNVCNGIDEQIENSKKELITISHKASSLIAKVNSCEISFSEEKVEMNERHILEVLDISTTLESKLTRMQDVESDNDSDEIAQDNEANVNSIISFIDTFKENNEKIKELNKVLSQIKDLNQILTMVESDIIQDR